MRIAGEKDFRGYQDATVNGGLKGALLGAGISIPAYYVLMQRSATYRALPLPLKALGAVVIVVPSVYISAEKAGERFSKSQYTGVGKRELDRELLEERERWDKLGFVGKTQDWAGRHKFGLIGAGWAGSMALAFAIVARNPYQSTSQKVVQARMWAQGLTVGLLVSSAMLTGFDSSALDEPRGVHESNDHTWKAILEEDPHLSDDERKRLHEIASTVTERKQQLQAEAKVKAQ
ncbi:hypothetical protein CI109_107232 [Kwoniella shandongensis]|uniref:Uncharacterized protein n=1 Tax=Kwoniella shandongensis TaxID=1734106 RepID=A0A5M6C2C6_9TREE|nr:uncharacterized protein CI109_002515 [Kwoniella shandongensis]KAA5529174.1 hypothetical protein CI109_002515 [Kwoniella shandongensis]